MPIQSLREGAELLTGIVGTTALSLRNTVGQILESSSALGPEVGELNVHLAGSFISARDVHVSTTTPGCAPFPGTVVQV